MLMNVKCQQSLAFNIYEHDIMLTWVEHDKKLYNLGPGVSPAKSMLCIHIKYLKLTNLNQSL